MVIQDRLALGAATGAVGTIPGLLLNWISVSLGFTRFYSFQLTGSVYLHPSLTDSVQGMILGGIIWLAIGAFGGILTAYLLSWTGIDYWWIKSVAVSLGIIYIAIYGFMFTQGAARIVPFDFATNFSELLSNILYGITTGYLAIHWGLRLYGKDL
jgi:hypothetical protein